ncbi:MAG TPA: hypothetical protein VFB37_12775 [Steroidobacteraceae bacterium]|nr:hypothetical protein [Steroidobacteraceae bacterium]
MKRELPIKGQKYIVAISPEGLKLTLKGRRNGVELKWEELVSGEAAMAVALNASLGKLAGREPQARSQAPAAAPSKPAKPARKAAK